MIHFSITDGGLAEPVPSAGDLDILDGGAGCGARLPRQPLIPSDYAVVVPDPARSMEDQLDRVPFVHSAESMNPPAMQEWVAPVGGKRCGSRRRAVGTVRARTPARLPG